VVSYPSLYYMLIKYKTYQLRSRHEFAWAQTFEGEGMEWSYETVTFRDGPHSYTPDFPIDGGAFFIEIKVWGANKINRIELCSQPLFIIFGMPDRHYVRFKPAGVAKLNIGHVRSWKIALQRFSHDIAA
jgi:hypothetical protein